MKISNNTLEILKNFKSINPGILFKEGDIISTKSPQDNILAVAKVEEQFPIEFAIYDLNNFLKTISLFKDGFELNFDDKHVIIEGGRTRTQYRFTNKNNIVASPYTLPKELSKEIEFRIDKSDLDWLLKSALITAPHFSVESDGTKAYIKVYNEHDDSSNVNILDLSDVVGVETPFKMIFKVENLKLISDSYVVTISKKGISKWESATQGLWYWITTEFQSKYGNN